MRGALALAALTAGSALCLATGVPAQDSCDLLSSRSSTVRVTRDAIYNYISEPVFGCEGGVVIRADSAELDDATGFTRFIGNFEYRDSTAFMTADRADHFASAGRLIGVGNVHIIDESTGAVFEGDSTVLVGSSSRRADGELTVVGQEGRRAHAVILVSPRSAAADSIEASPDSLDMPADAVAVASDSAAAQTDSASAMDPGEAQTDSVRTAAEVPAVPPDSARAETDSLRAPGDSAAAEPGSAQAPTDSTPPEPTPVEPPDSADAPGDSAALAAQPPAAPDPPPRDTTPVPYDIDAEHIYLRGAGYMLATGNAELYNDEFRALGDSIEYREELGKLFLRGTAPRVHGFGAEYVLSGNAVDLDMDGNQVSARGEAVLSGSEINLTAPEIRVLMQDGVLDRIVAMSERPSELELPGSAGEASDPGVDSAAVVASAAGDLPGDLGALQGDSGTVVAAAGTDEASPGDTVGVSAAAPADGTPGAGAPVAIAATGEPGAPQPATGEPGDSAGVQPPARPRAVAETFELEGDSISVEAPDQVLEQVVAVGNARGESLARDSLNTENTPVIARSDWVSGDTIIAIFLPAETAEAPLEGGAEPDAGSTDGGYRIERLVARGQAASLYRMTPSEGGGEEQDQADGEGQDQADGEGQDQAEGAEDAGEEPGEADTGQEGDAQAEEDQAADAGTPGDEPAEEAATPDDEAAGADATPDDEPAGEEGTPGDATAGEEAADPAAEAEPGQPPPEDDVAEEVELPDNRLAVHYVRGDLITIFMQGGEVTTVIVEGDARGIQLEPVAPPPPDSTASAPPSTRR